jgi:branched-chain amino acid transport system ATP-binding protein
MTRASWNPTWDRSGRMLKLGSLDIHYGHVHALKGVSIEVRDGELVALLGANGAGKTSTLMAISGIVRPSGGTITWDGNDLSTASSRQIVGWGIIHCPEGRRIFGGLSVLENLRMGAVRRGDARSIRADLDDVFSLFPILKDRMHQAGATLSGGEQQMLTTGRALMARPRLLMLDEPSLGLAPIVVQSIFRVIRELHRTGVTILLVEQNVRQALAVADRGYVMASGSLMLEGSGEELRRNPEIEQAYLGAAPEAGKP